MPETTKKTKPVAKPSRARKTPVAKKRAVKPSTDLVKVKTVEAHVKTSDHASITPVAQAEVPAKVAQKQVYFYAVGHRKTARAKVKLYSDDSGKIYVNTLEFPKYFASRELQKIVTGPIALLGLEKGVGITSYVGGGGIHAQAEALRHGISQALVLRNPEDKRVLKGQGYLTRDSRKKERKKPGLKRARRAPQWSKR